MLTELQAQGRLSEVKDVSGTKTLLQDLADEGAVLPRTFLADVARLEVQFENQTCPCDGMQTVDVLCAWEARKAVAIEVKLGLTQMSVKEFQKRFCFKKSVPKAGRQTGAMVSILERAGFSEKAELRAYKDDDTSWVVSENWWLVLRREVWISWRSKPLPVYKARILVFEDLAETYTRGVSTKFDELVKEIVGEDFGKRWGVFL